LAGQRSSCHSPARSPSTALTSWALPGGAHPPGPTGDASTAGANGELGSAPDACGHGNARGGRLPAALTARHHGPPGREPPGQPRQWGPISVSPPADSEGRGQLNCCRSDGLRGCRDRNCGRRPDALARGPFGSHAQKRGCAASRPNHESSSGRAPCPAPLVAPTAGPRRFPIAAAARRASWRRQARGCSG
jgi:hypothetical protein